MTTLRGKAPDPIDKFKICFSSKLSCMMSTVNHQYRGWVKDPWLRGNPNGLEIHLNGPSGSFGNATNNHRSSNDFEEIKSFDGKCLRSKANRAKRDLKLKLHFS